MYNLKNLARTPETEGIEKLETGRKREREKEEQGARRLERLHPAGARRCTVATLENALIAM